MALVDSGARVAFKAAANRPPGRELRLHRHTAPRRLEKTAESGPLARLKSAIRQPLCQMVADKECSSQQSGAISADTRPRGGYFSPAVAPRKIVFSNAAAFAYEIVTANFENVLTLRSLVITRLSWGLGMYLHTYI